MDLCHNNRKEKAIVVVLGNKADLQDERDVEAEAIRAKIEESQLPYFEVSAKNGMNIKEAFQFAGNEYYNANVTSNELTFTNLSMDKTTTNKLP